MKITKIGHCCLVVEENGVKIMTDPGNFSAGQDTVTGLHAVLITHEHADHLHVPSLKSVLVNNPQARIITNSSVGKLLAQEGMTYEIVEHGSHTKVEELLIEGFGEMHEEIFRDIGRVQNTGYFIGNKLFYPGDAFTNPHREVDVLALPVAGPWCKIKDSILYAKGIRPRIAFPVHDGMIIEGRHTPFHMLPEKALSEDGVKFIVLLNGETTEV